MMFRVEPTVNIRKNKKTRHASPFNVFGDFPVLVGILYVHTVLGGMGRRPLRTSSAG
jgi:hypothetical protein